MEIQSHEQGNQWSLDKIQMLYLFICLFSVITVTFSGCVGSDSIQDRMAAPHNASLTQTNITENIERTLVGHSILYYDIAGDPRYYNISKKDIHDIHEAKFDGEVGWIVVVGHGLEWEIHLNESGETILKQIQLFRT